MHGTIVINALGGPGAGKSTLSYGLTALLKSRGHKAELVQEYAKELVYRRDFVTLANQFEVVREQDRRLRDLLGQVDFIVNDSPLILGILFAKPPFTEDWFTQRTWDMFNGYNNFNVFVRRVKKFDPTGRIHSEEESKRIDDGVLRLLGPDRIHLTVDGDEGVFERVYEALMNQHNLRV